MITTNLKYMFGEGGRPRGLRNKRCVNSFLLGAVLLTSTLLGAVACGKEERPGFSRYDYPNILDIRYTPNEQERCAGMFTDAGSWWGFTPPRPGSFVNGFCGPFQLDMNRRVWFSDAIVKAGFAAGADSLSGFGTFTPDTVVYYPGELYMKAVSPQGSVEQRLVFLDEKSVLLNVCGEQPLALYGDVSWGKKWFNQAPLSMELAGSSVIVRDTTGEGFAVTFAGEVKLSLSTQADSTVLGYTGRSTAKSAAVLISFLMPGDDLNKVLAGAGVKLGSSEFLRKDNLDRWNGYLKKGIRADMPADYNRVAAKAITTLIANWRSPRGDLFHSGVVPSHAMWYFVGFWGWDSWKHAVALARFAPELAKDQVRAMYDYQDSTGMIIDCIYSDKRENNARDSKPPLSAWAVNEIYKATGDSAFVKEMYPKMVRYFNWWYSHRDHNGNGVCEFGACDGTLEAAAWESGMDNAIRFDDAVMVYNGARNGAGKPTDDGTKGWSMNQESVDLNAFLAYEHKLLGELAPVAGATLPLEGGSAGEQHSGTSAEPIGGNAPVVGKPYPINIAEYFYSKECGFFFDRTFDGKFVMQEGTEACIPLWAGLATADQAAEAVRIFENPNKFATFIPFPTIAADNPKFTPNGYWRGPIWLDQVYFGINGLRKYGYTEKADEFTRNVFDRLYGLKEGAPIHENYNTHNGGLLKASHFSWSSAHLLMLYWEYGKIKN